MNSSNRNTSGPFTLRYQGRKFKQDRVANASTKGGGIELLRALFSEIGALVIRYHIGQGQRVGLIQQITDPNYEENPVQKPAHGHDQQDLFSISPDASPVRRDTQKLGEFVHYPLGKGKVLNERAQPLIHTNAHLLRGEQALWDKIHSPVWNVGINLASQLSKQGFMYVCCPNDINQSTYDEISQQLKQQKFEIIEKNGVQVVKLSSGQTLEIAEGIQNLAITMDPQFKDTFQKNGFIISYREDKAPMGWFIHKNNNKMIEQNLAENLIRVIRISKGGFYELPPAEQALLQADLLKNNGFGLFTQNQAFNAMNVIFPILEEQFGFDSSTLMSSSLKIAYDRVQELFEKTDVAEDFLTGILLTEMVQPLRKTQEESVRSKLPLRFTNPFKVTQNNAKAVAYAFNLKDKEEHMLLQQSPEDEPYTADKDLLDVAINGELRNPKLDHEEHISALLSAAILVSEQMMIEKLLRDAVKYGDDHVNAHALRRILKNDEVYQQLIKMASELSANEKGPILGLQFSYCDQMVEVLRKALKHDVLIQAAKDLFAKKYDTDHPVAAEALAGLFEIGEVLQQLEGVSVRDQYSRGINAGLLLVIQKLAPELNMQLAHEGRTKVYCQSLTGPMSTSEKEVTAENCPYLTALKKKTPTPAPAEANEKQAKEEGIASAPAVNPHRAQPAETKQSIPVERYSKSWCTQFTKVMTVSVVAASVYIANEYIKNSTCK